MDIPTFVALDAESTGLLEELAKRWRDSPGRPRVEPEVLARWERLLAEWCEDPTLPLLVRRSAMKGTVVPHEPSGRELLYADNSPGNWAMASALLGRCPGLGEALSALKSGAIPSGMVKRAVVGAPYPGLLRANMDPPNLDTLGWKVCHILRVGPNDRTPAAR